MLCFRRGAGREHLERGAWPLGLQVAGRRKEWGTRESYVGDMELVGLCLRTSKTTGVVL